MSLLLLVKSPSGLNLAQTVTDPVGLLDGVTSTLTGPPASGTNTFEGGTDEVQVSVGNSGGLSGAAFDAASVGAGATLAYDDAHPAHGSLGLRVATGGTATTVYAAYTTTIGAQSTIYGRAYLYLTANPTVGSWRFFWARGEAAGRASINVTTAGKISAQNAAGGAIFTTTASVPLNQTFRVEWKMVFDASAGLVEVKLFSTADSTTPTETQTSTATQALGGTTADDYRHGITTSQAGAGPYWLDDLRLDSTGYPGPAVHVTDPVGLVDSISQVVAVGYAQTVTDPVGLLDSLEISHARTLADPVGLVDAAGQVAPTARTLADPVGLVDAAGQVAPTARTLADPVGILDTAGQAAAHAQTLTDPAGLLDSLTAGVGTEQTRSDLVALVDSLEVGVGQQVSDVVGLLDSLAVEYGLGVTLTDTLGVTDQLQVPRWTTELGTADSGLSRIVLAYGADLADASDPIGITDQVTVDIGAARTVTDPVRVYDVADPLRFTAALGTSLSSLSRIVLGYGSQPPLELADAVGVTDQASQVYGHERVLTDPVALADQLSSLGLGIAAAELVGIADSLELGWWTAALGTPLSGLSRVVLGFGSAPPLVLVDAVGLVDSITLGRFTDLPITDPVGLTDSLTRASETHVTVSDLVGVSDPSGYGLNAWEALLSDPVGVADGVAVAQATITTRPGHVTVTISLAAGLTVTDALAADLTVTLTRIGGALETTVTADGLEVAVRHDDDLLVSLSP